MIVAGHLYESFSGWAYLAMAGLSALALVSAATLAIARTRVTDQEAKKTA